MSGNSFVIGPLSSYRQSKCTDRAPQKQQALQFLNNSPVAPHKSFTVRSYLCVTAAQQWISDTLIQVQLSIMNAQQRFTDEEKNMNKLFFGGLALAALIGSAGFSLCDASPVAAQAGPGGQRGQRGQVPPPQGEQQGRRGGPGGDAGMMFRMLDLSSDQKNQIKQLHDAEREAAKPIHEQLKTIHEQLRTATTDGAFNESAVRSLLAQAQQPELELEVLHLKTRTASYNLLTPAQKAKLADRSLAVLDGL